MGKFLEVLKLALSLLPWIQEAESLFGDGKGAEKKAFILHAVEAGGDALMTRFGVPQAHIEEFHSLVSDAVDLGVHLCHAKGLFEAHPAKLLNSHLALAQTPSQEMIDAAAAHKAAVA